MMIRTICSIMLFTMFFATAHAAPVVNGVGGHLGDDGAVTVSGSGFGTHSMRIEWLGGRTGHIETSAPGTAFAKGGWNILPMPETPPTYDTSRAYSGSKSIIFDSVRYGDGRIGISFDPGAPVNFGYVSWMAYIDTGGASGQWKMFRINWERAVKDTGPEMTLFNWFGSSDTVFVRRSVTNRDRFYPSGYPESGEWVRMELYLQASSAPGANDGVVELWAHRPGQSIVKIMEQQGLTTYQDGNRWRYVIFQNYQGNGLAGSSRVWMDDIYMQDTRARVEIGNAPTWSACTHREIQSPTSWNDGSVTFTLNQGAFQGGQQLYLYVVDPGGQVNQQGYPIVLG